MSNSHEQHIGTGAVHLPQPVSIGKQFKIYGEQGSQKTPDEARPVLDILGDTVQVTLLLERWSFPSLQWPWNGTTGCLLACNALPVTSLSLWNGSLCRMQTNRPSRCSIMKHFCLWIRPKVGVLAETECIRHTTQEQDVILFPWLYFGSGGSRVEWEWLLSVQMQHPSFSLNFTHAVMDKAMLLKGWACHIHFG